MKKQTSAIEGQIGKIPTVPVNYDLYEARRFGTYKELGDELKVLEGAIKAGLPYLWEGEKGIGKTMGVTEVCARLKIPLVSFSCSSGTTMGDIIGREHLMNDNSVFHLGVLPTAIEVANKFGSAVLYLDELNALEPEIQKQLNPVIDDRRSLVVNDKLYALDKGVTFTIIATMNPSYYGGTNPLNEDLRSRFIGDIMDYPSSDQIREVIDWKDIPKREVIEPLLQMGVDTLNMKKSGKVEYVLSIRDMALFVKAYNVWKEIFSSKETALVKAINTGILIKYADQEERETVKQRCMESFGVSL